MWAPRASSDMSVRRFIVSPVACRITPNSAFNLRHHNK